MKNLLILLFLLSIGLQGFTQVKLLETPPKTYLVNRTTEPIVLDGKLEEPDWQNVPWTEEFLDIEGPHMPAPHYRTRVKMLWDDEYFYISAEMEEPHIWATFTERESIIFHENNFEVFIDPSGDTHNYYELEINALGTIWDLMLTKPYRNAGIPISAWDVRGFRFGIHKQGTINDPSDIDTMWTLEMAFPWKILAEAAPGKRKPRDGEQWRINFSRVQWRLDIVNGEYRKTINPETGQPYPEYNWVWSPQWAIDMHRPEYWGYVQFSDVKAEDKTVDFINQPQEIIKYILRELYYLQHGFFWKNNRYAKSLIELNPDNMDLFKNYEISFDTAKTRFRLSIAENENTEWHISEDSRIWKTENKFQERSQFY